MADLGPQTPLLRLVGSSNGPVSCASVEFVVPEYPNLLFSAWGTATGLVVVTTFQAQRPGEDEPPEGHAAAEAASFCPLARLRAARKAVTSLAYGGGPGCALAAATADGAISTFFLRAALEDALGGGEACGGDGEGVLFEEGDGESAPFEDGAGEDASPGSPLALSRRDLLPSGHVVRSGSSLRDMSWTQRADGLLASWSDGRLAVFHAVDFAGWRPEARPRDLHVAWSVKVGEVPACSAAGAAVRSPVATANAAGSRDGTVSVWWPPEGRDGGRTPPEGGDGAEEARPAERGPAAGPPAPPAPPPRPRPSPSARREKLRHPCHVTAVAWSPRVLSARTSAGARRSPRAPGGGSRGHPALMTVGADGCVRLWVEMRMYAPASDDPSGLDRGARTGLLAGAARSGTLSPRAADAAVAAAAALTAAAGAAGSPRSSPRASQAVRLSTSGGHLMALSGPRPSPTSSFFCMALSILAPPGVPTHGLRAAWAWPLAGPEAGEGAGAGSGRAALPDAAGDGGGATSDAGPEDESPSTSLLWILTAGGDEPSEGSPPPVGDAEAPPDGAATPRLPVGPSVPLALHVVRGLYSVAVVDGSDPGPGGPEDGDGPLTPAAAAPRAVLWGRHDWREGARFERGTLEASPGGGRASHSSAKPSSPSDGASPGVDGGPGAASTSAAKIPPTPKLSPTSLRCWLSPEPSGFPSLLVASGRRKASRGGSETGVRGLRLATDAATGPGGAAAGADALTVRAAWVARRREHAAGVLAIVAGAPGHGGGAVSGRGSTFRAADPRWGRVRTVDQEGWELRWARALGAGVAPEGSVGECAQLAAALARGSAAARARGVPEPANAGVLLEDGRVVVLPLRGDEAIVLPAPDATLRSRRSDQPRPSLKAPNAVGILLSPARGEHGARPAPSSPASLPVAAASAVPSWMRIPGAAAAVGGGAGTPGASAGTDETVLASDETPSASPAADGSPFPPEPAAVLVACDAAGGASPRLLAWELQSLLPGAWGPDATWELPSLGRLHSAALSEGPTGSLGPLLALLGEARGRAGEVRAFLAGSRPGGGLDVLPLAPPPPDVALLADGGLAASGPLVAAPARSGAAGVERALLCIWDASAGRGGEAGGPPAPTLVPLPAPAAAAAFLPSAATPGILVALRSGGLVALARARGGWAAVARAPARPGPPPRSLALADADCALVLRGNGIVDVYEGLEPDLGRNTPPGPSPPPAARPSTSRPATLSAAVALAALPAPDAPLRAERAAALLVGARAARAAALCRGVDAPGGFAPDLPTYSPAAIEGGLRAALPGPVDGAHPGQQARPLEAGSARPATRLSDLLRPAPKAVAAASAPDVSSGMLDLAAFGMGGDAAPPKPKPPPPDVSSGMLDLAAFGMGGDAAPPKPKPPPPDVSSGMLDLAAFGMGGNAAPPKPKPPPPDVSSGMLDLAAFGMGGESSAPQRPHPAAADTEADVGRDVGAGAGARPASPLLPPESQRVFSPSELFPGKKGGAPRANPVPDEGKGAGGPGDTGGSEAAAPPSFVGSLGHLLAPPSSLAPDSLDEAGATFLALLRVAAARCIVLEAGEEDPGLAGPASPSPCPGSLEGLPGDALAAAALCATQGPALAIGAAVLEASERFLDALWSQREHASQAEAPVARADWRGEGFADSGASARSGRGYYARRPPASVFCGTTFGRVAVAEDGSAPASLAGSRASSSASIAGASEGGLSRPSSRATARSSAALSKDAFLAVSAAPRAGAPSQLTWPLLRLLGAGSWLRGPALTAAAEAAAKAGFARSRNPDDAALFYVALGRVAALRRLYHAAGNARASAFLAKDFEGDPAARQAAAKNAFVLLGQHRHPLAAAFFLLSGSPADAVGVAAREMGDPQLAEALTGLIRAHSRYGASRPDLRDWLGEWLAAEWAGGADEGGERVGGFHEAATLPGPLAFHAAPVRALRRIRAGDGPGALAELAGGGAIAGDLGAPAPLLVARLTTLRLLARAAAGPEVASGPGRAAVAAARRAAWALAPALARAGLPSLALEAAAAGGGADGDDVGGEGGASVRAARAAALLALAAAALAPDLREGGGGDGLEQAAARLVAALGLGEAVTPETVAAAARGLSWAPAKTARAGPPTPPKAPGQRPLRFFSPWLPRGGETGAAGEPSGPDGPPRRAPLIRTSPDVVLSEGQRMLRVDGERCEALALCALMSPDVPGRRVVVSTARAGLVEGEVAPLPPEAASPAGSFEAERAASRGDHALRRRGSPGEGVFSRVLAHVFDAAGWGGSWDDSAGGGPWDGSDPAAGPAARDRTASPRGAGDPGRTPGAAPRAARARPAASALRHPFHPRTGAARRPSEAPSLDRSVAAALGVESEVAQGAGAYGRASDAEAHDPYVPLRASDVSPAPLAAHPTRPFYLSGDAAGFVHLWRYGEPTSSATFTPLPASELQAASSGGLLSFGAKLFGTSVASARLSSWDRARALAWCPDGERFAGIGSGGILAVWDANRGNQGAGAPSGGAGHLPGHLGRGGDRAPPPPLDDDGHVPATSWTRALSRSGRAVTYALGGTLLAAGGQCPLGSLALFDARLGPAASCVGRSLRGADEARVLCAGPGESDHVLLVGGAAGVLSAIDVRRLGASAAGAARASRDARPSPSPAEPAILWSVKAAHGAVSGVAAFRPPPGSPARELAPLALAVASEDGGLRFWNAADGRLLQSIDLAHAARAAHVRRRAAVRPEAAGGELAAAPLSGVAACPDGVVTAALDGTVKLFPYC